MVSNCSVVLKDSMAEEGFGCLYSDAVSASGQLHSYVTSRRHAKIHLNLDM